MFYIENNDKIVLFDDIKQNLKNTIVFKPELQGLEIKEVPLGYTIVDFELIEISELEEREHKLKRDKLNMLSLTAADVERAIYKAIGLDFNDILEMVKSNPDIDSKALAIEFKANNFYRGNPYISQIGALLGFSDEMLDEFFTTNDYTKLISEE